MRFLFHTKGEVMDDLSLVSTSDLLKVLQSRFDNIVFAASVNNTGNGGCFVRRFDGDPVVCMGLCKAMSHAIAVDFFEGLERSPEFGDDN